MSLERRRMSDAVSGRGTAMAVGVGFWGWNERGILKGAGGGVGENGGANLGGKMVGMVVKGSFQRTGMQISFLCLFW